MSTQKNTKKISWNWKIHIGSKHPGMVWRKKRRPSAAGSMGSTVPQLTRAMAACRWPVFEFLPADWSQLGLVYRFSDFINNNDGLESMNRMLKERETQDRKLPLQKFMESDVTPFPQRIGLGLRACTHTFPDKKGLG
jgi:hypothetical protein